MQRPICSQAQRRACTTLSNTHFFCEVTTLITASMTEEETSCSMCRTKGICSCFSPYTSCRTTPPLPPPSPAGSTIRSLTIWLPSHPQVLLLLPAPHCNLQTALKVYSTSPGVALPTFVGLASQARCPAPRCLSALPGLRLLLQWGTPTMTLPGTELEKTSSFISTSLSSLLKIGWVITGGQMDGRWQLTVTAWLV